ncbi:MAG TPA: carcinine hydrolase/isopenicillin-N N-acyltransferase family protein [Cyclobacteriaceae bacterium]|nr:carcinine hydrolase/isopenicillin-N N-acyltransferase family protein [Cyclobacteriaceae bacterium]
MCDTLLALRTVTRHGTTLLAKNSDREPDEAQSILMVEAKQHAEGVVRTTFMDVPQVSNTYACILSKPFQMWGAEMGVNEHGLAIGNEAVFTNVKIRKTNTGLTGMDLLRLALERCRSVDEAIACITGLLEQYGQDACGGYRNKGFYYHNSFLITDGIKGCVLETAGRHWAVEWVTDRRSISNGLSIHQADQCSDTVRDFASTYSDWLYTTAGRAKTRQHCTTRKIDEHKGQLTAAHCMQALQTHNLPDESFKPGKATTGAVCMHATSFLNPSQTTGSMVAELRSGAPATIWLTGTSMPCLSLYVPYFFHTQTLHTLIQPSDKADGSLWWEAEQLHRWICKDYPKRRAIIAAERSLIQTRFIEAEMRLLDSNPSMAELEHFSSTCLTEAQSAIRRWLALIPSK